MDLGLEEGGVTVQESFEIDPLCCEVQRKNFDHKVTQCDMTQKLVGGEAKADVMVATYPCTKYSTIADIHGTRTGDELYLHAFRHFALGDAEVWAVENVPGMKKFPIVMEAMTKLPAYYVTVFCPISTQTWLPQKRDRLIIIGSKREFMWRPPESVRRISLQEIIEKDPQVGRIPDYFYKRLEGGYRDLPIVSDPERDDIAPTCVAHYSKDVSTRAVKDRRFPKGVRPYTVREYARLQGLPDSFEFLGTDRDAYRQIGNGVSVPVGRWLGKEIVRYFRGGRQR